MDGMAIFAVIFMIVMFASLFAYGCETINDGKDPVLESLADKLVKSIDSYNEKKEKKKKDI